MRTWRVTYAVIVAGLIAIISKILKPVIGAPSVAIRGNDGEGEERDRVPFIRKVNK